MVRLAKECRGGGHFSNIVDFQDRNIQASLCGKITLGPYTVLGIPDDGGSWGPLTSCFPKTKTVSPSCVGVYGGVVFLSL